MTTLTEQRNGLAAGLRDALGDAVPVYAIIPNNVSAPCVVVVMRGAAQDSPGLWHQEYRVVCVAPGGDNEAAVSALEELLTAVAQHLAAAYRQPAPWEAPGTMTIAGQIYLTAHIDVTLSIAPKEAQS